MEFDQYREFKGNNVDLSSLLSVRIKDSNKIHTLLYYVCRPHHVKIVKYSRLIYQLKE